MLSSVCFNCNLHIIFKSIKLILLNKEVLVFASTMSSFKKSRVLTEQEVFADILGSMDIDKYDHYVILALSEYAKRITSELLCDAKDYSNHAQKNDIDTDDMDTAIKLSMHKRSGITANTETMNKFARTINSQDLSEIIDKDRVLIKYPRKLHESLLQRSYTYIPGSQAYAEDISTRTSDINNEKPMDIDNNTNTNKEFKTMQLPNKQKQANNKIMPPPTFQED